VGAGTHTPGCAEHSLLTQKPVQSASVLQPFTWHVALHSKSTGQSPSVLQGVAMQ
jgi:hypothetical protein